ncbi:MAG: ClpXP protease specificity-enhancing factor SspB [Pseudomonadota bacterium]
MPDPENLNYGRLMQRAMRGLLAEVLGIVAEEGLPGEHHFYINFDTTHPGVDMADWLHEAYPQEMTIVLQEWFADLAVMGDRFQVTLNFDNEPHTLVVPLDAVLTFVDPSVEFGLKFDGHDGDDAEEFPDADAETAEEAAEDDAPAPDAPSADVVSLDRFRKN